MKKPDISFPTVTLLALITGSITGVLSGPPFERLSNADSIRKLIALFLIISLVAFVEAFNHAFTHTRRRRYWGRVTLVVTAFTSSSLAIITGFMFFD